MGLIRFFAVSLLLLLLIQISSIAALSRMDFFTERKISNPPLLTSAKAPAPAPAAGWSSSLGDGGTTTHISRVSRHRPNMAGGDVILGGFAFALVTAIVCYIRVTRRTDTSS